MLVNLRKDQNVSIVGAGVFGLSTALHLARDGFTDVTVFDAKPYDQILYDEMQGCDAASADVNKILRASYGEKAEHQHLAYDAREAWKHWNAELAATVADQLPDGLKSTRELYIECGFLRLTGSPHDILSCEELAGLANLEKHFPKHRLKNYIIDDPTERQRAVTDGWQETLDSVNWTGTGVLDATAGLIRANKACIWLTHLARKEGVRFVEGDTCGKVVELLAASKEAGEKHVTGVRTSNGKRHQAGLVIVAAGGWTPALVPETRRLLESTAGSIVSLTLSPQDERPDFWERFSPQRWPVISRDIDKNASGGVYSFPHLDGNIKIGYRATKFTNYADTPDGDRISTPVTAYTTPSQSNVPLLSLDKVKDYICDHFPELVPLGISYTRLCWYIDSIDNNFLIDYVPGYGRSLFIASGGSGHGFKFAPILGAHVLDVLYGRETTLTNLWKWRSVPDGKRNGLEEGETGPRVLRKHTMATRDDWKIEPRV